MMLKKLLNHFSINNIIFILIVAGLIAVRFIWLDKFPSGINHDEVDVILSAKTYWLRGEDISGVKFPMSLFFTKTEAGLSGLPSVILSPYVGMFNLSLANARLPFVVLNILTCIILALLVRNITGNKTLSKIAFLVSLVNPWFFYYSRATTEAPFALLFTLLGLYFLFREKYTKLSHISAIFFALAFYSYFGAKVTVPILVMFCLLWHKIIYKYSTKFYFVYFLIFIALVSSYFFIVSIVPDSTLENRSRELTFANMERFQSDVDEQRKISINTPVKELFFNKYASVAILMGSKYLGWLSSDFLFFKGDPRATYTFSEHGVLYLVDLVFLILGIFEFGKTLDRRKKLVFLVAVMIITAPIAPTLSSIENSYVFRSYLLPPAIIIVISAGIYFAITSFKKPYNKSILYSIGAIYFVSVLSYLNFYFFRYPVKMQEANFLEERVLANYMIRSSFSGQAFYIVVPSPKQLYQQYLFFSKNLYFTNLETKDVYYLPNGITITNECEEIDSESVLVVDRQFNCSPNGYMNFLTIQNQKDSGTEFKIYNDKVCEGSILTAYRRDHLLSDYSIEKMELDRFCNRWINKSI